LVRRTPEQRLPCAPDEHCVVIADGSIDAEVPQDLAIPIGLITIDRNDSPNVSIRSVTVSAGHETAAGVARAALSGSGVEGRESVVRVFDGAAVIGSATHRWAAAGARQDATIAVPWWPIDGGARALRVEVSALDGEKTAADNHVDVG
jgi:hypothetical protein